MWLLDSLQACHPRILWQGVHLLDLAVRNSKGKLQRLHLRLCLQQFLFVLLFCLLQVTLHASGALHLAGCGSKLRLQLGCCALCVFAGTCCNITWGVVGLE